MPNNLQDKVSNINFLLTKVVLIRGQCLCVDMVVQISLEQAPNNYTNSPRSNTATIIQMATITVMPKTSNPITHTKMDLQMSKPQQVLKHGSRMGMKTPNEHAHSVIDTKCGVDAFASSVLTASYEYCFMPPWFSSHVYSCYINRTLSSYASIGSIVKMLS